ncbi:Negative regulator of mitotic exit [Coniosporium apollinis]|uniref:Negative regulator of mitotic exit n=1 Tax=Coniosporium apollinis TaxID=61459 RepID=A0ABQ9NIC4_9PEZI|nr:Negative regulator of mitotic exit [Coniosporium apollinis]
MSFLFKSKKSQQQGALPAATRNIGSSHGQESGIPTLNGHLAVKDAEKGRSGQQLQTPSGASSANNSLNSLPGGSNGANTEPKLLRERSDSDVHNGRMGLTRNPSDSPYPWTQRRMTFTAGALPFPRYGAAVNSNASKEGSIYLMGGLINGSTVKGDLWMVEAGHSGMACYQVPTTAEGPGPRVGHASLLVGNAFIVFGGDTKMDENDVLDDTLYLLNTSTKAWSRALPAGPRPAGRYGHTLNILGSKIYIFGGQVEGQFFNDLVAFDLNALQAASNRWELLIASGPVDPEKPTVPPARTNHSMITWNDKLYLFGGTDGHEWFNDVWTYDPRTNEWEKLACIGFIPSPREGHSAALVNDTMYIFGGRNENGVDQGDLAAFRISSRRWYMFQNMGPSPSPRSGHSMTAFGKNIVVLAGEPSSQPADPAELSLAYVLDTSKIRYPAIENQTTPQPSTGQIAPPVRKNSGGQTGIPQSKAAAINRDTPLPGQNYSRGLERGSNAPQSGAVSSKLPRAANAQGPPGPPPQQQPPQPRANGIVAGANGLRNQAAPKPERGYGPPVDTARAASFERENQGPVVTESPQYHDFDRGHDSLEQARSTMHSKSSSYHKVSMDTAQSSPSRSGLRSTTQRESQESMDQPSSRPSVDTQARLSREGQQVSMDSGLGSSPDLNNQNDELVRELEAAKSRNAWLASELALARKAGYQANASNSPILDERAADAFGDDERPLLEALVKMRTELANVQDSIDSQAIAAAARIAEIEKQRDAAINEAVYAKAKLAAHGGSAVSTPQLDGERGANTPDSDRLPEINRRLASSLAAQTELSSRVDGLIQEIEAEKRARQAAEETAEAAQKRVAELDSYKQRNTVEADSLRAKLHEVQKVAREEAANAAEAHATSRLLTVDKNELSAKLTKALEDARNYSSVLQSLRDGLNASSDKALVLERKLEEERSQRDILENKLQQLKAEHELRTTELETTNRRLRDTEELAEKHAEEARTHRQAVLAGIGRVTERDEDEHNAADERVTILQQQVQIANAMVRKNQEAADTEAEKLRRAEERIAGLEAYQEQVSRESLQTRRQLQAALREVQSLHREKADMTQHFERQHLESNALEVQLKTLKTLLEERGVNAADVRRSRALDSPNSRFSTPELNRIRELEQQLEVSFKAHDELRSVYEQREHEVSKEWEEKLAALDNDHQAAVKYLRGTEKMLSKMKQELQRYKNSNTELEREIAGAREQLAKNAEREAVPPEWETERNQLHDDLARIQSSVKADISSLESRISQLQSDLATVSADRDAALHHAQDLETSIAHARQELETFRHENALLEERTRDAERRCQLFLDQFESSVDNYRRMSQLQSISANGSLSMGGTHKRTHDSISGDSIYSQQSEDDPTTPLAVPQNPYQAQAQAARNSVALDSLATELDALRTHWETTNKNYRLDDKFDFERTPTTPGGGEGMMAGSLVGWRKRMELEDDGQLEGKGTGLGVGIEEGGGEFERKRSSPVRDAEGEGKPVS